MSNQPPKPTIPLRDTLDMGSRRRERENAIMDKLCDISIGISAHELLSILAEIIARLCEYHPEAMINFVDELEASIIMAKKT